MQAGERASFLAAATFGFSCRAMLFCRSNQQGVRDMAGLCQSGVLLPLLLLLCPCRTWCSPGGSECAWGMVSPPALPPVTPLPALAFAAWPFLCLPRASAGHTALHPVSFLQPASHWGHRATYGAAASREPSLPWLKLGTGTHPQVFAASPAHPHPHWQEAEPLHPQGRACPALSA